MAIQYQYMSPGTYIREEDLSARLRTVLSTSGAAVYESKRGPMGPTFYSTGRRFIERNGKPDPTVSFAHDCILAFMEESSVFWGNRVTNGALYAGATYFVDRRSKNAPAAVSGQYAGRVLRQDFPIGSQGAYDQGSPDFTVLTFAGALITGNVFTMDITDGEDLTEVTVTFATDHATTMQNIAAAISTALAEFGDNGVVQVYRETASNLPLSVITIRSPDGVTVLFNDAVIASGTTQTTVHVDSQAKLLDVFAENPGEWGNNIGFKLTGFDMGIRQRFRMTVTGAMVTGNALSVNVNGRTIGPITFATDSDGTLEAIATALVADPDIATAIVRSVPGARNNDRTIDIVAEPAGAGAVTISGAIVTGSNAPSVVCFETLKGVAPTGEFQIEVYERPNSSIPKERFLVTMNKRVDGRNRQQIIDQQVNKTSGRSDLIRVVVPESARSYAFKPELFNGSYVIDKTINWLAGGDDGVAVMNSQIRSGWQVFRNRERIPATLLINCGYTDPSVQQEMVALAEFRFDAFAILDMPSDKQRAQDAYNYRMQDLNIDSSYGAMYTPDLLIADDDSDELRYVPPSGHVAACYALTDRTAAVWFAPAGLNRGKLKRVRGLRIDYELGDRELLSPAGINCIIDKIGAGPTIWDEVTLQLKASVLSGVHARRLMNMIEVAYADGLDYVALFDPNNSYTQFKADQVGRRLLQPIKDAEGIYDFEIVTDSRINTDEVVEDEMMKVDVYVDVVRTAKRIVLTGILTPKGAKFAELIAMRGARV